MSEWTVPVRNDPFLAMPRRAFLLPAGLFARFFGTCFFAGFIFFAIGPSSSVPPSRAAANTQYTVILSRPFGAFPRAPPAPCFRFCRQSQCAACRRETRAAPGVPLNAGRFLWSWFIDWLRRPFGR